MATAFVMIQAEPSKIATIAKKIAKMPNVAEVYSVAGEFDILVVLRTKQYEDLAQAVPEKLATLPGIRKTNTVLAFREFSLRDKKIGWDLGLH